MSVLFRVHSTLLGCALFVWQNRQLKQLSQQLFKLVIIIIIIASFYVIVVMVVMVVVMVNNNISFIINITNSFVFIYEWFMGQWHPQKYKMDHSVTGDKHCLLLHWKTLWRENWCVNKCKIFISIISQKVIFKVGSCLYDRIVLTFTKSWYPTVRTL